MSLKKLPEDSCNPDRVVMFTWRSGKRTGQFMFYEENGKLLCDNETLCGNDIEGSRIDKEFVKQLLCKMIDDCEIIT